VFDGCHDRENDRYGKGNSKSGKDRTRDHIALPYSDNHQLYRRRFCSTRCLARYGPDKMSMRHSITLTTATPIAAAKAKSRMSTISDFRILTLRIHLDPATGPVNDIPALT
jgi:hypothetical protein